MRIATYDDERYRTRGELFPLEIEDDLWVLFHGTSGNCEEAIERDGLRWTEGQFSRVELSAVVSIFERLEYRGVGEPGGFPVLKPFSLEHDFGAHDKKPIFLGETAARCHLYASVDFAGGETARALRHAFTDLHVFLGDDATRREEYYARESQLRTRHNMAPVRVPPELLEEARADLRGLAPLEQRARQLAARHNHGVIYAIRFAPELIEEVAWAGGMGIHALADIPPSRLIAKVRVPRDARHHHANDSRRGKRISCGDGIVASLVRR